MPVHPCIRSHKVRIHHAVRLLTEALDAGNGLAEPRRSDVLNRLTDALTRFLAAAPELAAGYDHTAVLQHVRRIVDGALPEPNRLTAVHDLLHDLNGRGIGSGTPGFWPRDNLADVDSASDAASDTDADDTHPVLRLYHFDTERAPVECPDLRSLELMVLRAAHIRPPLYASTPFARGVPGRRRGR
jgi:hypothetical protein